VDDRKFAQSDPTERLARLRRKREGGRDRALRGVELPRSPLCFGKEQHERGCAGLVPGLVVVRIAADQTAPDEKQQHENEEARYQRWSFHGNSLGKRIGRARPRHQPAARDFPVAVRRGSVTVPLQNCAVAGINSTGKSELNALDCLHGDESEAAG
jgi:hypothetical protein